MQFYRPAKAAICLQNAREKELSAQLYEKLGQVRLFIYSPLLRCICSFIDQLKQLPYFFDYKTEFFLPK